MVKLCKKTQKNCFLQGIGFLMLVYYLVTGIPLRLQIIDEQGTRMAELPSRRPTADPSV